MNQVFGEFYQLHNEQRDRRQGLGLGLSIVKRLCDLLDHRLELRSKPGSGSVMSILIPQGDERRVVQPLAAGVPLTWDIAGLSAMVIDDDIEVLKASRILLEKWGCRVTTAASLTEALDKIGTVGDLGLVLSDLRLPGRETGVQALDAIRRKLGRRLPGILITGDTQPERISLALKSGYKVLHKPLKPAQLRTAIQMGLTSANNSSNQPLVTGDVDAFGAV